MRKHFLLLFLMALLPLAGWAAIDISGVTPTIATASFYFTNATPDVDMTVKNPSTLADLDPATDFTLLYYNANQQQIDKSAVKAVGTYYVAALGAGGYEGTTKKVQFNIVKMPLVLTGVAGTRKYGASGAETIYTVGTTAHSIETKNITGYAQVDLTDALKTKISFSRVEGNNAGAYDITAEITDAEYAKSYSIASADITDGTSQVKYTINPRDFVSTGGTATVTIAVSANLTYNGLAQEATVTVTDKIAALGTLTRGYIYETFTEYNAAHPTATVANQAALEALTIAQRTKTPGDYFLTFGNNTNASTTATVTVKGMGNYAEGTEAPVNFTIKPAPLFVIPTAEKVYDGNTTIPAAPLNSATGPNRTALIIKNDDVTLEFQGFVDTKNATHIVINTTDTNDPHVTEAPALTWKGTATANVGENYAIKFQNDDINKCFALDNYTFIPMEGTFKITQKTVTGVADNVEIAYGDPEVFALKAIGTTSLTEAANDADKTALTDAIKIVKGDKITEGEKAGKYLLTPSYKTDEEIDADETIESEVDADGTFDTPKKKADEKARRRAAAKTAKANYKFNPLPAQVTASVGYLTISQATLYIALKQSEYKLNKIYDGQPVAIELNKTTGLTIMGKKGDDVINVDHLTLEVENNNSKAALYTLRLSGADADNPNYAINYIPSQYQINQKPLKVTASDQTFVVNTTIPTNLNNLYQIDATDGLAEGDQVSEVFKLQFVAAVNSELTGSKFTAVPTSAGWAAGVYADGIDVVNVGTATSKWNNYVVTVVPGDVKVIDAAGTLVLDDTKAMKTTLAAANNTNNNVTFTTSRNLTANSWNVMVLPFDIKVSDLSKALGYAVIDVMDETADDGNVHFNIYMGTIKANTPFMFKVDDQYNNLNQVVFENKTIVYNTTNPEGKVKLDADGNSYVTDKAGNKLIGTYKSTPIAEGQYYFGLVNGQPGWKPAAAGASNIKGERAILVLASNSDARQILIEEPDGSTTAISTVAVERIATINTGWYTLNGVKLNAAPTEKGVYINNGKKVVVK